MGDTKKSLKDAALAGKVGGLILLVFVSVGTIANCVGPQQSAESSAEASRDTWIGGVQMQGACDGSLDVELRLAGIPLPLRAEIRTKAATQGVTVGQVALQVAGVIAADCLIGPDVPADNNCAISLLPRAAVRPLPLTEGQNDATP